MKRFYKELGLLSLFFFCLFPSLVRADMCSEEEIARLKVLANNISVHYEYLDADDESLDWGNTIPYGYNYAITVSGMSEGMYFTSTGDISHEFHYSDTDNGSVTYYIQDNGTGLNIRFYPDNCFSNYTIKTKELDLPIFNSYYNTAECREIRNQKINLDVCQKTISKDLIKDSDDFYLSVDKYLNVDVDSKVSVFDRIKFLFSNIYAVIGGISVAVVLVIVIVFLILRHIKRSRLD